MEFKVVLEFRGGKVIKLEDEFTKDFPGRIEETWEYLLEHGSECFSYSELTESEIIGEYFEFLL